MINAAAEKDRNPGGSRNGNADLQSAADEDEPLHLAQACERKLESNGEQQQHNADLGELLDGLDLSDQPEAVRADRDPGQHQPD